ncbi:unnamed protein product [Caenorhabditis auriculariae]|uniref:Uncharacterized protein n=1 Tax=Caenorhabditis auriculariae TaxID=2777116 RepID=A0A8S1H4Z2_9PELO|nr:unnamed protein product [Caenorhabditis auriculariae]
MIFQKISFIIFTNLLKQIVEAETTNAMSIYKSEVPIEEFENDERAVKIGEKGYILLQNWNDQGVSGVLWESAVVLAQYLHQSRGLVKGKRILELGAGLGLPSMVVLDGGAFHVFATDQMFALPRLRQNVQTNLSPEIQRHCDITCLDWFHPENSTDRIQDVEVIIGADLVYNRELFDPLRRTLLAFSTKKTVIFFASKLRYPKDRRFYSKLSGDFQVEQVFSEKDIVIFKMLRN